ncbi:hypothetical protein P7K49_017595 [Saguinus oedipus]|uniref:C2 domain-containing protein n=1 Tax=Saguinus oedipus TaxID=9490 RepID=A0ABQ9V2Z8_SAGOE|nr:hypothetical protein P7K49_017595 [Saguinus oedipus]
MVLPPAGCGTDSRCWFLSKPSYETETNVLELIIYDEDSVTEDDICFKFLYDISEVLPGKLLRKTFSQSPQVGGGVPGGPTSSDSRLRKLLFLPPVGRLLG